VSYFRFGAMIATSTVVMFVLMYLNTYVWSHVFFSETRVYMALLMGATMAIIMLSFMLAMYANRLVNVGIYLTAVLIFIVSLWLVRSQTTVGDVSYMRAMIPHHSIAIMTSERANISDPRVRKLADEIIAAQRREIGEMRYLIAAIEEGSEPPEEIFEGDEEPPEVVTPSEALEANVLPMLDPGEIDPAEADRVLGAGAGCTFSRTVESDPILVARSTGEDAGPAEGLMMLNGELVRLRSRSPDGAEALVEGPEMVAEGVAMRVSRVPGEEVETTDGRRRWPADLVFELEQGLTVGYRGNYSCRV